ncbi:MAG: hypothetical protein HYS57_00755 [Parcubacteria group bacterium]|nr:hypothetical protein [Parcubacteria group bacterium]
MAGFSYYKTLEEFMAQNGYVIDGTWYPRVTSIISIKSKPALYKFYGEAASFGHALSISGRSASLGTKIHGAIETILRGEEPEADEEVKPSIEAFRDFQAVHTVRVKPEGIEQQIVHRDHRYAGTLDALAEINGKYGILDIKTSSGIWRDYNLQTAAYLAALQQNDLYPKYAPEPPATRWILRIDQVRRCRRCDAQKREKGGRETIRPSKFRNIDISTCDHIWSPIQGEWEIKELEGFEGDFRAFLACKTLWEWENEHWLKQIGHQPPIPNLSP